MCGIAGWFKVGDTTPEQDKDIFHIATELFFQTKMRGTDASGFSYFKKSNGELVTVKGPVSSAEMIRNPQWTKLAKEVPSSIIMHCRAMTKGSEYDNMNNHPLVIDKRISVIHNGGIWNDDNLRDQFKLPSKGQVDSEVIPMMIDRYLQDIAGTKSPLAVNTARAINLTSQSIMGSYSCAMLSKDVPNVLYLFNHKNPVALAYCDTLNTIFFASTDFILNKAFEVEENKLSIHGIFNRKKHIPMIYEMKDDTLTVLGVYEKQMVSTDEFVKDASVRSNKFTLTMYELKTNSDTPWTKGSVTPALRVNEDELKKLLIKKGTAKKEAPAIAAGGAACGLQNFPASNHLSSSALAHGGYPGEDAGVTDEELDYLGGWHQ